MAWIRKDRIWPTAIVLVLVGNVALGVVLMRVAGDDQHFAVEPDYYRKAVAWDATMLQAEQNMMLGWQVVPRLGRIRDGMSDTLRMEIQDSTGTPVLGASVALEAMPIAYANAVQRASLEPTAVAGEYAAGLVFARPGLWEFRLTIRRDAELATAVLRMDLSADAPAEVVTARPGDARP